MISIRYQLNPDGISYISIAHAYANFHLKEAINGYWSPLISWLLIPAFWLHLEPVAAFYILDVVIAISIALIFYRWARSTLTSTPDWAVYAITAALLFTLVTWALSVLTPDLLFCLILIALVFRLASFMENLSWKNAVLVGICGALLFFTKSVGLPLFVIVFVTVSVSLIRRRHLNWKPVLLAWAIFGIVILPFCGAISVKYNKLTFSTSGAYNLSLLSPTQKRGQPINGQGIFLPHYPGSVSPWDDPTYLPVASWTPLQSIQAFGDYLGQVWVNIGAFLGFLIGFGAILVVGFAALLMQRSNPAQKRLFSLLLFTSLILGTLYVLTLVEARYIWALVITAFFGVAGFAEYVFGGRDAYFRRFYTFLIIGVLVASIGGLSIFIGQPRNSIYYQYAGAASQYIPAGSRVAYDDFSAIDVCLWAHLQCVGILPIAENADSIKQLRAEGIDYFMLVGVRSDTYNQVLHKYYKAVNERVGLYELK